MTVRAISHQIVIAIQSTSDGSTARHPHDTMDLLFSCCVMNQLQIFSMHPLTNFHRYNNQHTCQRPKPRFYSSQKCHGFASNVVFAALQLPLWSAVSSRLFSLHSDAVVIFTYADLSLSLSLVDSSLLAFLPALEEYSENITPKSGPLTSTQRKSFD